MRVTTCEAKAIGDKLKVNWNRFNLEQFRMGLEVEWEHRKVLRRKMSLVGKVVLDHLRELPDYYTRLKKMERKH